MDNLQDIIDKERAFLAELKDDLEKSKTVNKELRENFAEELKRR